MADLRDTDDALLTATEHARVAEERLTQTPLEDPALVTNAKEVHQRAEDVDQLAKDAASQSER